MVTADVQAASGRLLACGRALDHADDFALLHDQEILATDLDLGPRPFAEEHGVADGDVDGGDPAPVIASAGPDGDDLSLLRLFLNGIGYDNTALGLLVSFEPPYGDPIMQRAKCHGMPLSGWAHISVPTSVYGWGGTLSLGVPTK